MDPAPPEAWSSWDRSWGSPSPKKVTAKAKAKAKAKVKLSPKSKAYAKEVKNAEKKVNAALRAKAKSSGITPKSKAKASPRRTAAGKTAFASPKKRPQPLPEAPSNGNLDMEPAVVTGDEAERLLGERSSISKDPAAWIAKQAGLDRGRVHGAVRLFREGNTLPFIARYRKEQTKSMNEEELRRVERELSRIDALEDRRAKVAAGLEKCGALSELRRALLGATALEEIEDLWAPFKSKKKTRAQIAKERGLGPLAEQMKKFAVGPASQQPEEVAAGFLSEDVPDSKAALAGARDILAEQCAHKPDVKQKARDALQGAVTFVSKLKKGSDDEHQGHFKTYWDFKAPLQIIRPHQFLAMQRGEAAKSLTLSFSVKPEAVAAFIATLVAMILVGRKVQVRSSSTRGTPSPLRAGARSETGLTAHWEMEVEAAMTDSFKRLLLPALERDWRNRLRDQAEDQSFDTYRRNLRAKLLAPPLRLHPEWRHPNAVLGVDPAFRTGCKCALISDTGQVLATKTLFPHALWKESSRVPEDQAKQAMAGLHELIELGCSVKRRNDEVSEGSPRKRRRLEESQAASLVCSIGNGTASRETEAWIRQQVRDKTWKVGYTIVDEAGASIYSASKIAGAELPDLDVSMRGAVSIARRLLDPLSELVKIDPQSIGVGLYQHDVDQKRLATELRGSTADCVNSVGVDLNTASPALLQHVAGLSAKLSQAVIKHRDESGTFRSREELQKVRGIGPRIFQQAAGFLRVYGGSQPLDELPIHPESYKAAQQLQGRCSPSTANHGQRLRQLGQDQNLAAELGVGLETLVDIGSALADAADSGSATASDPRCRQQPPRIKNPSQVKATADGGAIDAQEAGIGVADLKPGMLLEGVVRNVVAFGAFIDIGVESDGLLHVSNYKGRAGTISVNDRVEVSVLSAEVQPANARGKSSWRIKLSMK